MTEQTAGSRFRLGVSAAEDWRTAVDGCLLQLMPLSDAANIGFVYISDRLADKLPKIVRRLSAATGIEMIVGACAYSVAAGDTEFCDEPVVACLIGEVPDDSALQIGRASCRARVCQYVSISGVAVPLKKKTRQK